MVKVLLFQLFPSHNVVPSAEEPLAVISAGDVFLVPTAASTPSVVCTCAALSRLDLVNLYGKKGDALGRFSTTDSILQLRYLAVNDT
jgi:hypothetical protein